MKSAKLGIRKWLSFIVAGLIGQLAWAIENNYLNVYVFDCTQNYDFIPLMTLLSAVAATVTTLLIGALSDRLGKRKLFISCGYIIWGLSIVLFAFLDHRKPYSFIHATAAQGALLCGTFVVILDCVMTFFGSTANDAAFNAFVTDNTETSNRGKVEAVLSILPLVAMIAVVLLQGMLVPQPDPHVDKDWLWFFVAFGGITTLSGIILIFLLPKDVKGPNKEEPYFKNIIYGFRPKVIKSNAELYLALLAFMIFSIGIQVFMPYFMVYVNAVLGYDLVSTAGPILGVACVLTVLFGFFMDKIGKYRLVFSALGATVIGGIILFIFNKELNYQIGIIIGGIVLMTGYLVSTAVLGAKIRDYTPEKETGLFQGVRMVFVVLIPMVTGPYIGKGVSYIEGVPMINEYGKEIMEPNKYIFLFAIIIIALAVIPLIFLMKREKANKLKLEQQQVEVSNEQTAE